MNRRREGFPRRSAKNPPERLASRPYQIQGPRLPLIVLLAAPAVMIPGVLMPAAAQQAPPVVPGQAPLPGPPLPGQVTVPGQPTAPGQAPLPNVPPLSPAPTTSSGEQAPPLRVPPPPELLPPISPTLPPGTTPVVPANVPLTLDQAIAIGLANQPNVGIAQQGVVASAARTRQSTSSLLPSLSFSAGGTRSLSNTGGGFGGPNPSDSYNETLSARQLLFDFQHTASGVRAARDEQAASVASAASVQENTVLSIKQAYFTLLEDTRLVDVSQQALVAQNAHLAEARAIYGAGRSSQVDVFQAQTNVANAELTLADAQNAQQLARADLNVVLGIDPRTPITPTDVATPTMALPDLNALVTVAEANRPEVVQAQDVLKADQELLINAKTSNLPSVSANGSIGMHGSQFPGTGVTKSVGIGLSWDVFDAGLTSGRVQESQANLQTARLQLYQAQQTVINDVTQAYLNVVNARQRVITTTSAAANAEETLRLAEGRYQQQIGLFIDITDAQAALIQAQANQINAIYGLNGALAALDRAIGQGQGAGGVGSATGSVSGLETAPSGTLPGAGIAPGLTGMTPIPGIAPAPGTAPGGMPVPGTVPPGGSLSPGGAPLPGGPAAPGSTPGGVAPPAGPPLPSAPSTAPGAPATGNAAPQTPAAPGSTAPR